MPDTFKPIGDLFNQAVADVQSAKGIPIEKPWAQKTEDEKLDGLLEYCLRSDIYNRSRPPFDREWFERAYKKFGATMDDIKYSLEDTEDYCEELVKKNAFKYTDVRGHALYRLKKYLANKAHLMKKKQSYAAPVQRVPAKIELPKEQFCPECKQYLPRDFFTLDGICVNCGQQECASCHELFKNKDMKMRRWKLYCKTCFEKL